MRSTAVKTSLLLALVVLLAAMPAIAAEKKNGIFGIGVAMAPDYEGSEDYQAVPLLHGNYKLGGGRYISLFGTTLRANLLQGEHWQAGPLLRYRAERDDVDNNKVDDMDKVDAAFEIGAFGAYKMDRWLFMLSAAQDVADGHDGYLVDLSAAYTLPIDEASTMNLSASTSYASDDYMEAYFQVDSGNVGTSGLSMYNADAGFKDVSFGATYQYDINDSWGVLGVARYTRLLGDAKDSPVVDDEGDANQMFGGVAVNYRF